MDEKQTILGLIEKGELSAKEGEQLLLSIKAKNPAKYEQQIIKETSPTKKVKNTKSIFVIEVNNGPGDEVKVRIPLHLARLGISLIGKQQIEFLKSQGIDIDEIVANIDTLINDFDGDIVNIRSMDGEAVRIYIEK